jgi:hypothetical protein
MALSVGTNCGFVSVAPTADPEGGSTVVVDNGAFVVRFTSPADATNITSMGWWCNGASEEANFEVGLYASDGAVVPGEAGTRLQVSATNAKGTDAGWKVVTGLNWTISPSTVYWLAAQVDNTATPTSTDRETIVGESYDILDSLTTLPDPFGDGTASIDQVRAIYAVCGLATTTGVAINPTLLTLGTG